MLGISWGHQEGGGGGEEMQRAGGRDEASKIKWPVPAADCGLIWIPD